MIAKIKDIATVVSGGTPSTDEDGNFGGHIVWITPKDLSLNVGSKYIFTGERNITKQGFDNCSAQMIPANNILITTRAPIGYIAINQIECCTNQGFKSLICNTTKVDVDFLYYYLHTQVPRLEKMGTGTTFKEVSKSAIEDFEIDLPSLTEQKKIASFLSQIDEQIQRNNDMVHKLRLNDTTISCFSMKGEMRYVA